MNPLQRSSVHWATRLGVILAVTGSAVGLGNFLRFPGQVAQHGGGAFMVPYVIAFVLLGLPIAWAEWSLGRFGGSKGYNSSPGIFRSVSKKRATPYFGIIGPVIPVMIYMYYVFIEAWCLAYAWYYLTGDPRLTDPATADYEGFFTQFVGAHADGFLLSEGGAVLIFLVICFALNFVLIYRGLNKGIEWFCRWAMPALIVCALIVLVRVLTLGAPMPDRPEQNILNGLGYMWNPVQEPQRLAPGDEAIGNLIVRTSVDAFEAETREDGTLAALRVLDAGGFAWALQQAGWTPDQEIADDADLANSTWLHEESPRIEIEITDGVAQFVGRGSEEIHTTELQATDPPAGTPPSVRSLWQWLPRDVAEPPENDQLFDRLAVLDGAGFRTALSDTGWETADDDPTVHEHPGSRLRIVLGEDDSQAVIASYSFLETLADAEIWVAATGQIFFTLSVGFGIILTYSSYVRRNDDVALSSVTAAAGNSFCEVVLGGLIVIPAAFVFLGVTTVANPPGTFGMGFVSLPNVFAEMPMGRFVGFLFFFLLFLAAVTSSLSMLQPAIALLEEGLGLGRKASVAVLGFITAMGSAFIVYFSKNFAALDTIDFWVGTLLIYVMATIQVILFGWVLGIDRGMSELRRGAEIKIPNFVRYMIKYVAPVYLLTVFGIWLANNAPGRVQGLFQWEEGEPPVALMSVGLIICVTIFFGILIARSVERWDKAEAAAEAASDPNPDRESEEINS
ncbi:MAG: hypothetical protein WD294_08790 [Phycisphaeraceae bacterium]